MSLKNIIKFFVANKYDILNWKFHTPNHPINLSTTFYNRPKKGNRMHANIDELHKYEWIVRARGCGVILRVCRKLESEWQMRA